MEQEYKNRVLEGEPLMFVSDCEKKVQAAEQATLSKAVEVAENHTCKHNDTDMTMGMCSCEFAGVSIAQKLRELGGGK